MTDPQPEKPQDQATPTRRTWFQRAGGWLMGLGLVTGYGAFASIALRFLFPSRPQARAWLFAVEVSRLRPGSSMPYTTPSGENVIITRQGEGETASDFIALSSTCPHLGCRVHWEAQHNRFFCPCHNGTFDTTGKATGGPPKAAGQDLPRFELRVENGLLVINVPIKPVPIGTDHSA